ncbi:reprolysin-like metallopeptidase [Portibacter marinus]|uniref:reprolysin-like metallopeptidase n=1 Tax=Portibacter marinus TaxID=2898660 RepID=UPI001F315BBB|nr:zinc-dependent metalloprotease family protein [Portibacter marinus]
MKHNFIFLLICFLAKGLIGQSFFTEVQESSIQKQIRTERSIVPTSYRVLEANFDEMKKYLTNHINSDDKGKLFYLIDPEGKEVGYSVFETKMMQDGIAAKYPGIKTYMGYHPERKSERVYFGFSSTGFYATVRKPGASYSIDRYADKQDQFYISYYTKDHIDENIFKQTCGTIGESGKQDPFKVESRSAGTLLPLREYRFALACTGEFGAFYGPSIEDVLGEMMKSVNRMNMVLENDFAVRLVIVDNNDKVINTDPENDFYTDGNTGSSLLAVNTKYLTDSIGFANFDIGHVYTRGCDDTGGIAAIRSACAGNKGAGVTCHYNNDITAMAIRVAAHEVGHQLGSNHTFNNCNGNENSGTAYEPGSGTTIMSYGGLCGSQLNVTSVSDDYFHVSSIIEVTNYTREGLGGNCPNIITTNNHIPEINLPLQGGFAIPVSTPFELIGEATDEDGDELTYTWEQFNLGPMAIPGEPVGNSPLFVSAYPSHAPTRVFPDLEFLVNNVSSKTEVLPSYERDLNFQFVVRDNNLESGGVAWEEIDFYTTESAGPFVIDFPNQPDTFQVGEEIEVLWDVANTDNEIVGCKAVDILLSQDGGYTYDVILLENTPNDGQEKVFMPNLPGDAIRLKVKAAENIFFDINDQNITIAEPVVPGFLFSYTPGYIRNCVPQPVSVNFTTESILGYDEPITFEVLTELPEDLSVEFSKSEVAPGETTTALFDFNNASLTGIIPIVIQAASLTDTLTREVILDLVSTDFSNVAFDHPKQGSSGNGVAPILSWKGDSDAQSYDIKLSDNPSFNENQSDILYKENVKDTFFILDDILNKNTVYYWQVTARNECGVAEDPEVYAFATEAVSCNTYSYNDLPLGISPSGILEIDMPINIIGDGQVTDVNIKKIRGTHSWVSELKGEIISPEGTKVLLFRNKCGNQSNFNLGFDDEAMGEVTCPLSQGLSFKPQEKLDTFNGQQIAGEWLFKLTDTKVGNGGTVQEYNLEVCSNAVLDGPSLINNEKMGLPNGFARRLSSELLLTEDGNNTEEELVYTLVRLPQSGILRNEDQVLSEGDQFSQKNLNEMTISYQHDGTSEQDSFLFTVQDGEGGWISITSFDIFIDNDIIINTEDVSIPRFKVFPNPVRNRLVIEFTFDHEVRHINLLDATGRSLLQKKVPASDLKFSIDVSHLTSGIYFLNVQSDAINDVRKIIVP